MSQPTKLDILEVQGGGVNYTIKQAFANPTASGNTAVVAAVTGKKIRVVWMLLGNGGAAVISVNLQSATTAKTATYDLAADGGGTEANPMPGFICETVAGEALNINLSATGTVGITINYIEV